MRNLLLLLLFCSPLLAQDSIAINGHVSNTSEDVLLIEIDFGSTPTVATLQLNIAADLADPGLAAKLQDLDGLLDNAGTQEDAASSSGSMNLTVTTGATSGVHQFFVWASAFGFSGSSNYSGTLSVNNLPAGSITLVDTEVVNLAYADSIVHGRMLIINGQASGSYTDNFHYAREHTGGINDQRYYVSASGSALGSLELREIIGSNEQSVATLNGAGNARGNLTNTAEQAPLRVIFNSANTGDVNVTLILGVDTSLQYAGYGDEDNTGPFGCSVGNTSKYAIWLLLMLTLCAGVARKRHTPNL